MKFRMVDRITWWRPREAIRGVKTVSFEEYSLKAAFGGPAYLPEMLLMEALFQLGNWLVILSTDFQRMGLVVRIGRAEFPGRLGPGQRLDMEVVVTSFREDGIAFDGTAHVAGRLVALGAGCLAVPVPLADHCDVADLKALYGEIHRDEEARGDGAA